MFLDKFISALLPSFEKDRLISDIRVTRGELSELQAAYSEAAKLLKSWKFQDEEVKRKFADFKSNVGTSESPIAYIDKHLVTMLQNLQIAEDQAVAIMGGTIAGKGLTVKQATIVKYCDALFLVSKYSRKFLNWVYVKETLSFDEDSGKKLTDSISQHEIDWLHATFLDFCTAVAATSGEPKKVLAGIEGVPEVELATGNLSSLRNTMGDGKVDPLKLGFIASKNNPIYFVRMMVAEFQVRRYKEMKEELSLLQLRRMNLEKLKGGKNDANIEKQIEYVEGRAGRLSFEIAEMEAGK